MAEIKFETALKRLEGIVDELEMGELDLDKSLGKFEEGIKLTKFCSKYLNEAEKKIEILLKDRDGNLTASPFSSEFKDGQDDGD